MSLKNAPCVPISRLRALPQAKTRDSATSTSYPPAMPSSI